MAPFTHSFRIRYHECDAQGHVFNANYFAFFDVAITELWRSVFEGGYKQMLEDHRIDMVVAQAGATFHGSARFDELVDLDVELTRVGTTATTTAFTLRRGDETLVEGELRHVYLDVETWAKTPIPEVMRTALAPFTRA